MSVHTALLIIDVQQGLFEKPTPIYKGNDLLKTINSLINKARAACSPVIFVRHASQAVLPEGTQAWKIHPLLQTCPEDLIIEKKHPSAFHETCLKDELKELGITRLVITGLVTHGCVKATTLDAKDSGYQVVLVEDGHSSYSKQAASLIDKWNDLLAQGTAEVIPASNVVF